MNSATALKVQSGIFCPAAKHASLKCLVIYSSLSVSSSLYVMEIKLIYNLTTHDCHVKVLVFIEANT